MDSDTAAPSSLPVDSPVDSSGEMHKLELQRRANREAVGALGFDPYGVRTPDLTSCAEARRRYDESADQQHQVSESARSAAKKADPSLDDSALPPVEDRRPRVAVGGRVVLHRDNGKLVWLNVRDHTGDVQVALSKRDCDERGFALAKKLDLGDLVVVHGPLMKTRAGEVTIWAEGAAPGGKCLTPPPEKRAGLQDLELRYRKRYVDLWSNPETMRTFTLRSRIVSRIRRYLDERGYLEVETPMLQTLAGGAAARPFRTTMNALGLELFMRIAPELYLKRLLVGGMARVYELNRNFRNEGLDKTHNPEFTVVEVYEAFGDYGSMMSLTEGLIRELARVVILEDRDLDTTGAGKGCAVLEPADEDELPETLVLPFGELKIDYGRAFERVTYAELFDRALGFRFDDFDRARSEAEKRKLKTKNEQGQALDPILIVNELFEEVAEASIDPARPTFVTDYPAALSPLTKGKKGTEGDAIPLAERWDLFIAGMEIGPAYTELNDPDVQAERFKQQLAGLDDEENTFRTFDEDFIEALKVGMPPAGGLGLGIDRLVMLLTNERTIRDVILFPLMRPIGRGEGE